MICKRCNHPTRKRGGSPYCDPCIDELLNKTCKTCQRPFRARNLHQKHCLQPDCESHWRVNNLRRNAEWKDKRRGKHSKRRVHGKREATGRMCELCHEEIYRIWDDGVLVFDARKHCSSCDTAWQALGDEIDLSLGMFA